jgi:hypothetical protein
MTNMAEETKTYVQFIISDRAPPYIYIYIHHAIYLPPKINYDLLAGSKSDPFVVFIAASSLSRVVRPIPHTLGYIAPKEIRIVIIPMCITYISGGRVFLPIQKASERVCSCSKQKLYVRATFFRVEQPNPLAACMMQKCPSKMVMPVHDPWGP